MRILVISLAGIGDTLFATPLIHELRANFPAATIDALVMWAGARDLLERNPHLDSVYQKNLLKAGRLEALRFLSSLRRRRYDLSFNTHPQSRIEYRLVSRFINARARISHQYDNSTALDSLLVNRRLKQNYETHSIQNNLALLQFSGAKVILPKHAYELYLSPADLAWAEQYLVSQKLSGRKILGVHVGSGGTKNLALRRWPLTAYAELFQRLTESCPGLTILLFGGPEEEKDHETLLRQLAGKSILNPQTKSITQAAALLKSCNIFLSVDTALMHVAAAIQVPNQFVIETPSWNKPIAPYRDDFVLIPNPALKGRNLDFYRYDGHGIRGTEKEIIDCMASVSISAVYAALTQALD